MGCGRFLTKLEGYGAERWTGIGFGKGAVGMGWEEAWEKAMLPVGVASEAISEAVGEAGRLGTTVFASSSDSVSCESSALLISLGVVVSTGMPWGGFGVGDGAGFGAVASSTLVSSSGTACAFWSKMGLKRRKTCLFKTTSGASFDALPPSPTASLRFSFFVASCAERSAFAETGGVVEKQIFVEAADVVGTGVFALTGDVARMGGSISIASTGEAILGRFQRDGANVVSASSIKTSAASKAWASFSDLLPNRLIPVCFGGGGSDWRLLLVAAFRSRIDCSSLVSMMLCSSWLEFSTLVELGMLRLMLCCSMKIRESAVVCKDLLGVLPVESLMMAGLVLVSLFVVIRRVSVGGFATTNISCGKSFAVPLVLASWGGPVESFYRKKNKASSPTYREFNAPELHFDSIPLSPQTPHRQQRKRLRQCCPPWTTGTIPVSRNQIPSPQRQILFKPALLFQ